MADGIVAADLGAETAEGFLPVTALGFGRDRFAPPPALVREVAAASGAATGPVLTVSTVTGTAERAGALLAAHPGALAEAMEGFGVAEAAARAGVPCTGGAGRLERRRPPGPGRLAHRGRAGRAHGRVRGGGIRTGGLEQPREPGRLNRHDQRIRHRHRRRHRQRHPHRHRHRHRHRSRRQPGRGRDPIAYSPCPNDTFVFDAWAHGRVPGAPELDVTFADIDITNGMAERGELDVLKVSYAVLPWVLDEYALLPCGGALGRGCGPLVLGKELGLDLTGRTVAVPSERSTAYLLFRLWAADMVPGGVGEVVVMPFDEIMPAVRDGKVDAGLVIHEARFTYRNFGLHNLADMGRHWEDTTGLPIPLGAIIAKRSLGEETLHRLAEAARSSVRLAWDHPEVSRPVRHGARPGDGPGRRGPAHRAVRERVHRRPRRGRLRGGPRPAHRAAAEGLVPPLGPDALAFP